MREQQDNQRKGQNMNTTAMVHTTNFAEPKAARPHNMGNKTAEQIVEYAKAHYRVDYHMPPKDGEQLVFGNQFSRFFRAVFEAVQDPADWKNPFYARCSHSLREWIKAAIIFFHGTKPIETGIGIISNGYCY